MKFDVITLAVSAFFIYLVLAVDFFFYRNTKVTFLNNQTHINIYVLPLLFSYSFFNLSVLGPTSRNIFIVPILAAFAFLYMLLIKDHRIILRGAKLDSVKTELGNFLAERGRKYRFYQNSPHQISVEINNYPNAINIRDKDKWVEIESNIHKDYEFLNSLDEFFINYAGKTSKEKSFPNFFYFLILFSATALFYLLFTKTI